MLSRAWIDRAPYVASHPGDLEWWHASATPDPLGDHLRLWSVDGDTVAWSWVDVGAARVQQESWTGDPDLDRELVTAIMTAAIDETRATDRPLTAWAAPDDPVTIETLRELGFLDSGDRLSQFQRRVDHGAPIGEVSCPDGYRIRPVAGSHEAEARAEAHRAAFSPSKMSGDAYRRLMTLPFYGLADDLIAEASDGTIAAFAIAWWDPIARIGEFEPVGTHAEHRRRGLGRALLTHALRRYREFGAELIQVYSWADNAASEGLYQSVGFTRRRYRHRFERPPGGDVRSMA